MHIMNRLKLILSIAFLSVSVFLFSQTITEAGDAFNNGIAHYKAKNFTSAIEEYKKCIEVCNGLDSDQAIDLSSKAESSLVSAYMNYGNLKIACNSPELFLKGDKNKIETRPIKGTINRGKNTEEDQKNCKILLDSEKDQAELFMIIDLLRNDLGKVCEYGSIQVLEAKRMEAYQNVYHLVGIIMGILRKKNSYWDLLKASFPGGSITGCPKVSSFKIIEELETFSRNIYTGTIFMMNREYFISNIVIRTAVFINDNFFLNSGGAITIDSSPEAEYEEINHKLTSMMEILKR